MKHAKLMLTLGALLSTAAVHADVVEDAIKDSDLDTLRILVTVGTTHNHSFTVTKAQKDQYKALAQEQIAKCKEKTVQSLSVSELDMLGLVGFAAGTLSGASLIYKFFRSGRPEDREYTFISIGGIFLYGVSNTIRSFKDLVKNITEQRCKAKEALKKAEKVDKLVDAMPVEG